MPDLIERASQNYFKFKILAQISPNHQMKFLLASPIKSRLSMEKTSDFSPISYNIKCLESVKLQPVRCKPTYILYEDLLSESLQNKDKVDIKMIKNYPNKINHNYLFFLTIVSLTLIFCSTTQAQYGGGTGDPNDPYQIWTAEQMNTIGLNQQDWDKHFILMADIDLSIYPANLFNIIGYYNGLDNQAFTGCFDGNGYAVMNFHYDDILDTHIGIFGYVNGLSSDHRLIIKNVNVINPIVQGYSVVGGLVARLDNASISNCSVQGGSVTATYEAAGGLVGENYGLIENCFSTTNVGSHNRVGGLVGYNSRYIYNSYSTGNVSGNIDVGGFVGLNTGSRVINSYSIGQVTGNATSGGFIGRIPGSGCVFSCFWDTVSSGMNTSDGGVGLTTSEMWDKSTFYNWNCGTANWTIDDGLDYPRLSWENSPGASIDACPFTSDGGTGDPNTPYLISTAEQWNGIAHAPLLWDQHFLLTADIDMATASDPNYHVIGGVCLPFSGGFDGNGFSVMNLNYHDVNEERIGLFGIARGDPERIVEIKNVTLINPNITAKRYTGALVGRMDRDVAVENCSVQGGQISGESYIGGLIGHSFQSKISNCNSQCTVIASHTSVGGLVGINSGVMENCFAIADVTGFERAGGLVGAGSHIYNCYSTGVVVGDINVGGLSGSSSSISGCYSTCNVTGNFQVGGLVGLFASNHLKSSYSLGNVNGNDRVGGLVGFNDGGLISLCYSESPVSGVTNTGGLVGEDTLELPTYSSYWNTMSSGQATSASGEGKTTAELQLASTFVGWGCLDNDWTIDEGNDAPALFWQGLPGNVITNCPFIPLSGNGEPNDPFLINSADQLNSIGHIPGFLDKHIKLTSDIDLSGLTGTDFNIIGKFESLPFTGQFDGDGYTISNFTYNAPGQDSVGLFGYVSTGLQENGLGIKDVTLTNSNVTGNNNVGALVGKLIYSSSIENCFVQSGAVTGQDYVGGVIGRGSSGLIDNCYNAADVFGNSRVGGVVGNWIGQIQNCTSVGDVTGTSNYVGGVVGYITGDLTNDRKMIHCSSDGTITGNIAVGGLAGRSSTIIDEAYSEALVRGESQLGGLVGDNNGQIQSCFSIASVTGTLTSTYVGGVVGSNGGTISDCYNLGGIAGSTVAGGVCGRNESSGLIYKCYNLAGVNGFSSLGGLVGQEDSPHGTFSSFWNTETSGMLTSAAGEGKTTAEMQMASTYVGWGCADKLWTLDEGVSYPWLAWENLPGDPIDNCPFVDPNSTGQANDPILIETAEQMNQVGVFPFLWDKNFQLIADIDMSDLGATDYNIIGIGQFRPFKGFLDGNHHSISNLTINKPSTSEVGLFGLVSARDNHVFVQDLTLIDPNVVGQNYTGSLVGRMREVIMDNCHLQGGQISGNDYVGGLIGQLESEGAIYNCESDATVIGNEYVGGLIGWLKDATYTRFMEMENSFSRGMVSGNSYVGGLLGANNGVIQDCYSEAMVSGISYVGGFSGREYFGYLTNCYSTGSIEGVDYVGGLTGQNTSSIDLCYSSSHVMATGHAAGGLVGAASVRPVENSYASGIVNGNDEVGGLVGALTNVSRIRRCYSISDVSGNEKVGGFLGHLDGTDSVENSYATGSVNGNTYVGGFAGKVDDTGTVQDCYSIGAVSGNSFVGGFIGDSFYNSVINSYWDKDTSGKTSSDGGSGRTTEQMYAMSNYTDWDFVNDWDICDGFDYPSLQWQAPGAPELFVGVVGEPYASLDLNIGSVSHPLTGQVLLDCVVSPGAASVEWELMNGPAPVTFSPDPFAENVMVLFTDLGHYQLKFTATYNGQVKSRLFDLDVVEAFSGGTGTKNDPFQITTAEQLNRIGFVNTDLNKSFILMNDIDLSGFTNNSFNRIGSSQDPFIGCFNGNHFSISGFNYNHESDVGIFSCIDEPNTLIENVIVINPTASSQGGEHIGSLIGKMNNGIVRNCQVIQPNIFGEYATGGLIGAAHGGLVENCRSINGNVSGYGAIGGLIGSTSDCIIKDSYNTSILSGMLSYAGGIIGYSYESQILSCFNKADITGNSALGGIVGASDNSLIARCYNIGNISGDEYLGGCIGIGFLTDVSNSYNVGDVTGMMLIGGFVGYMDEATISNCYNLGDVSGDNDVGGFLGGNSATIVNAYSSAIVTGNTNVGGFSGRDTGGEFSTDPVYNNCFWNQTVNPELTGIGNQLDPVEVIAVMNQQMILRKTFIDTGWDFIGESNNGTDDIWDICEALNTPRLAWQPFIEGDLNCTDTVDLVDLQLFNESWLKKSLQHDKAPSGRDGFINMADWAKFLQYNTSSDIDSFVDEWMQSGSPFSDLAPNGGDGFFNMIDFSVLSANWLE